MDQNPYNLEAKISLKFPLCILYYYTGTGVTFMDQVRRRFPKIPRKVKFDNVYTW